MMLNVLYDNIHVLILETFGYIKTSVFFRFDCVTVQTDNPVFYIGLDFPVDV